MPMGVPFWSLAIALDSRFPSSYSLSTNAVLLGSVVGLFGMRSVVLPCPATHQALDMDVRMSTSFDRQVAELLSELEESVAEGSTSRKELAATKAGEQGLTARNPRGTEATNRRVNAHSCMPGIRFEVVLRTPQPSCCASGRNGNVFMFFAWHRNFFFGFSASFAVVT